MRGQESRDRKNELLIDLSESDRTEFGRVPFDEQAEEHKVFSAVWALESQVNNGGFLQYFASGDGDTAEFAPRALRTIGARSCASLVERALRLVSSSPLPESRGARAELLESLPQAVVDRLERIDQAFFAYPDDLTSLLYAYVSRHPEVFGSV